MNSPQTDAAGQPAQHTLHRGICPPNIAKTYANQRVFDGSDRETLKTSYLPLLGWCGNGYPPTVEVFRFAEADHAKLHIDVCFGDVRVDLTPVMLRELAARLLDAAHDIEQNPAQSLTAEQPLQVAA